MIQRGAHAIKEFYFGFTSDQYFVLFFLLQKTPTPRPPPPPPPPPTTSSSPPADRRDHGHLVARGQDRALAAVIEVILVEGEDKGAYFGSVCFIFLTGETGFATFPLSLFLSFARSQTKHNRRKKLTFELSQARVGSQDGLLESIGGGACAFVGVSRRRQGEFFFFLVSALERGRRRRRRCA